MIWMKTFNFTSLVKNIILHYLIRKRELEDYYLINGVKNERLNSSTIYKIAINNYVSN